MTHLIRPPSESAFPVADARNNFPRCIQVLEDAVQEALSPFWDETFRRRAHGIAQMMSRGCEVCGFRESSGLLRSLESLLALPYEDTVGIESSLAERLRELVALLKEQARRATA